MLFHTKLPPAVNADNSKLTVTSNSIAANGISTSTITLILYDNENQPISVGADNITITTNNGNYGTITKGEPKGNVITATLKSTTLAGINTITAVANGVTISTKPTITTIAPAFTEIIAAGMPFPINVGFPKTGIRSAAFKLSVNSILQASDYTWESSNTNLVTVNSEGLVTFSNYSSDKDEGNTATITAKNGDVTLSYTINLSYWFYAFDGYLMNWNEADSYCAARNRKLPTIASLTNATEEDTNGTRGVVGSLFGEWGLDSLSRNGEYKFTWLWTREEVPRLRRYYFVAFENQMGLFTYYSYNPASETSRAICVVEY